MSDATRLAARNNAEWCDAVCRAHGSIGRFNGPLWLNLHPTPPYYPNAVTLEADAVEAQLEAVAALRQALPAGFAVKDSFAALDLAPLGFAPLFQATWIRRAPGRVHERPDAGLEWRTVETFSDFNAWRVAWSNDGNAIFAPPLLLERNVVLIGGWRGGTILAGAALNRSRNAVGWSNVFGPDDIAASKHLAAALAFAARIAGPVPLVGYETDEALETSFALGFEAAGPLTIWGC